MNNMERLINLEKSVYDYYHMVITFLENTYIEELYKLYSNLLIYGTSIHGMTTEEIDYLCYYLFGVNCWLDLEEFSNFHFQEWEG